MNLGLRGVSILLGDVTQIIDSIYIYKYVTVRAATNHRVN